MIPLKLQVSNFLSYGDPAVTVDFEPHQLMCLSGKNGHGKSALLDAITWVLWGQARKIGGVARDDVRLIRLGQKRALVIFDFVCNGQRMRVKRELALAYDKTFSTLEFGIFDEQKRAMVPLTDKTIRLTQQKIEQLIGFTYESFTNSVFLRQGQSNEFSKKSAKERKDVLACILGLTRYDRVRVLAMEKMRKAEQAREQLQALMLRIDGELAREKEVFEAGRVCQNQLEQLQAQEKFLLEQQSVLRADYEQLYRRKDDVQRLAFQLRALKEQLQNQQLAEQLTLTQQQSQTAVVLAQLSTRENALGQAIQAEKMRAQAAAATMRQLCARLEVLSESIARGERVTERYAAAQRIFERRKELYHRMVGYAHWVNKELQDIASRSQQSHDAHQPRCPLCEQNLVGERQQFLVAKLARLERFYGHRLRRVSHFLRDCQPRLKQEQSDIGQFQDQLQQLTRITQERLDIQARLKQADAECDQAQAKVAGAEEQLVGIAQQKNDLSGVQPERQSADAASQQVLALRQQVLDAQEAYRVACDVDVDVLEAQLKKREQEFSAQGEEIRQQLNAVLQQQGRLRQEVEYCAKLRIEQDQCRKESDDLLGKVQEFRVIADALGKDGIQALLIEAAIPEIELTANALLARLSDQNARIFIESLRDLKRGGTRETLDINISDNAGMRPYEMFSGGEAFRIDFALRVAISQLLAKRSGAALQTLIIDEGFGSQDEDGLALIMDVLYKVQDSFAKIIVVSHLPGMKDQFPVHLVVEKSVQGSYVTVVEQG